MKGKIGIGITAIFAVVLVLLSGVAATGADFAPGDVNGDGQVNVVDTLFIQQYTVGLRELTPGQLMAADVNGDGQVNEVDALLIAQYTTNKSSTFFSPMFITSVIVDWNENMKPLDKVEVGQRYSIHWSSSSDIKQVTIVLKKDGLYVQEIGTFVNEGDAFGTPDKSFTGSGYQIQITDPTTGISGESKSFSIEPYLCGETTTVGSNWPIVELSPDAPDGESGGNSNQLVARFLITNPGPKEIAIERLQISQIAVNGSIERLTKNGPPRVFYGNTLIATGTNWTTIVPASPSVASNVVFATPLMITPDQTMALDIKVDTNALLPGDETQFTLDNMNWVIDPYGIQYGQYGIFNVPGNILTY